MPDPRKALWEELPPTQSEAEDTRVRRAALEQYFHDIRKLPRISWEREIELSREIREHTGALRGLFKKVPLYSGTERTVHRTGYDVFVGHCHGSVFLQAA